MTEPKCATCGKTISFDSSSFKSCQLCKYVDLEIVWCDEKCRSKGLKSHEEGKCAGPSGRSIDLWDETSYRHFCPPPCRVEIVTPRLRLRPVEIRDRERIFKIKNDPLVSDMQLYGRIDTQKAADQFLEGYVGDNIPCLSSLASPTQSRTRYVFAIEPRISKDGSIRSIQSRSFEGVKHELDAEGYIGNIAIELIDKKGGWLSNRTDKVDPKRGKVFHYPERKELKDQVEVTLFYELHPNFWRQGIMSEALKAILSFCFQTLNVPSVLVDPQVFNEPSIALAEQNSFKLVGEKKSWWRGAKQLVYRLEFEDWQRGRKKNLKKKKKEKGKAVEEGTAGVDCSENPRVPEADGDLAAERKKCCRWCQVPTSNATLDCSGCDWGFWCSQPCKTADLTYSRGHSTFCPGRNGYPSTNLSSRRRTMAAQDSRKG
ncbi:hypothetical protein JCM3765_000880 [Sporobolomyces pararoseus]